VLGLLSASGLRGKSLTTQAIVGKEAPTKASAKMHTGVVRVCATVPTHAQKSKRCGKKPTLVDLAAQS